MDAIEGKLYSPFQKETIKSIFKLGPRPGSKMKFHFDHEIEIEWERLDATVSKIRISQGYPVKSFRDLVEEVANVTLSNKNYEMFYRGQTLDYKDSQGQYYKDKTPKTIIYPTICRPDRKENGEYKPFIRKAQIIKRYDDLRRIIDMVSKKRYQQLDEFHLSLFQHYDTLPTPLIDITQSIRVAATFALRKNNKGYFYVFGLPYPHGSISHFIDQGIVLIKLQNVSPISAYRPRYQEGYLVGKYPIVPTKSAGDNLARRLVAKFVLDNTKNDFWDENFTPMPENVLFPKDDAFEKDLSLLKGRFLQSEI